MCRGPKINFVGQSTAALSGRVIGPAFASCQRRFQEIFTCRQTFSEAPKTLTFQAFAPYLSHNPATS